MTTVIVCGGRDFDDAEQLYRCLDGLHGIEIITRVVHGGAKGADEMAGVWAKLLRIPTKVYKADWDTHGKCAGPIRNRQMLEQEKPDLVVAFSGGRGTASMVSLARQAGVMCIQYGPRRGTDSGRPISQSETESDRS